jgi:hypothetical protein
LNVKIQNKLRLYNIKIQVAVPYSVDSESLNIYYYIVIVLLKPTLTYSHSFFSLTLKSRWATGVLITAQITHSSHIEVKGEEVL